MALILTSAVVCVSFIVGGIADSGERTSFQINKCCPENHILDSDLGCVETSAGTAESSRNRTDDLSWFPLETIVDSKTLKIHLHEREKYAETIRDKYVVNYGFRPECEESESKEFSFHKSELVELFNFVIHENGRMEVHVTKSSTFHDPGKSILSFHKISNESEAFPVYHHHDALRPLPLEDTCVDINELSIHILIYCPCRTMQCLRKCCADYQHFAVESTKCVDTGDVFVKPPFAKWRPKVEGVIDNYYLLSDTFPSCAVPLLLKNGHTHYSVCNLYQKASDNDFTIFPNGSVKVKKYKSLISPNQYCGDVSVSENGTIEEQNLLYCPPDREADFGYDEIRKISYGVLQIIGGFCLLLTVAISLYLPNLRRKVHNKIAIGHNISLMIFNFFWAFPQLADHIEQKTCIVMAVLSQFSFLCSIFWLNIMCIDISMTFSSNKHLKNGRFDGGAKKFIYYCIYALGGPSVITFAGIVMEFHPDIESYGLKPGYACICGFNADNYSLLIYFYGPMAVLLLTNIILFVYTAIRILNIQKQTSCLHKTDSNKTGGSSFKTDKERLILYGKLFFLMGVTWIMDVISWAIGGPGYYWFFTDVVNLLRAIFIFILFICKKQVFSSMKKKLRGESLTNSEKTNSGRSQTDVIAFSSSAPDNRPRGSIVSNKSKSSIRSESDFPRTTRFKPSTNFCPIKESSM